MDINQRGVLTITDECHYLIRVCHITLIRGGGGLALERSHQHMQSKGRTDTYSLELFKIIGTTLQICLVEATCKVLCLSVTSRCGLERLLLNRSCCLDSRCRVGTTEEHIGNSMTDDRAGCHRTSSSGHLCKHAWLTGLSGRCRWCGGMSRVCVRRVWGHSSSVSTTGLLRGSGSWLWCRTRGTRRTLERKVNKMRCIVTKRPRWTYRHGRRWW